ncbi:hypothetical protein [Sphingomonas daechungensis]|uniref:hypothetical protein n=1 Tax=Sphingomonas daechungensis TaxID=1176646 RepID=UPI003783BC62
MSLRRFLAAAIILVSASPALATDVESFLVRVHKVQRLGPFAFFSPEFYRLKHLVEADGEELKTEYADLKAAGRPTAFCPPVADKPRVSPNEYLAALKAVPAERRRVTTTKDVLRTVLERKYPCGR